MKKKLILKKSCMMAVGLLLSLCCYSCQDDSLLGGNSRVKEGLPATVTLSLKVDDMSVHTRSIANDESSHYCDNIWIGIYDKSSGERVDQFYFTDVVNTLENAGEYYKLYLKTESHNDVYIVAVANTDVNSSIDNIDNYGDSELNLRDMLDNADSFDKFKNICLLRPDATDVNVYANTLTMSGFYTEDADSATDPSSIQSVNIVPGSNNLDGAVYLQRVISYNKFVIVPGQYVNLTLNSWKVYNVPAGCYLFEQSDNIGDKYSGDETFYNQSVGSHQFTATTNADGESGHSFEFYQLENKHTGLDYKADGSDHVGIDPNASDWYTEREREYKTQNDDNDVNTGIYRSLVKSDKSNISNNNASYVVINADIDYYVAAGTDDESYNAATAEPVDPNSSVKKIHRVANVNYTIHLGYCEGKDGDDPTINTAKDFNCRRNAKYTYNVKIKGVKNVVVEATSNKENQPGAEGWVADETGEFQKLDAHYCEFNICLTDAERNKMSYRITAPYAGKYYYYSRDKSGNVTMTPGMNKDQYSWIKFYPTKDKNTLAKYNGGDGENSLGEGTGLWTFDNMCSPSVTPSPYEADSDGNYWYTVFIDEYVYTFDDEGSKETSWPNYVNQDDRIAEFIMNEKESKDTESTYSYCKYAFSQKSIQTYYTDGNTALGVEHIEETYCLNMNWKRYTSDDITERQVGEEKGYYDFANGRFCQYYYLTNKTDMKWKSIIQEEVPGHVAAGSQNGCSHPDADYPIYMPQYGAPLPSNRPIPGDTRSYYANSICMSRNRDLDGDDDIDTEEIRWYLPTSAQYIQIAIAQTELPDPIMRFTDYDKTHFSANWSDNYTYGTGNFHYVTADYQYYWAEQAVNTGNALFGGYNADASVANTVRCVRNLGTNLKDPPVKDVSEIDYAYKHDATNRTFTQIHYSSQTLRGYNYGGIAPHDVSSPAARPYKEFEYAKHICVNLKDKFISFGTSLGYVAASSDPSLQTAAWTNSLERNGICGQYTQEEDKSDLGSWRIPSVYELALMWIENIPQNTPSLESGYVSIGDNSSYFLSATYDYFISYNTKDFTTDNQLYMGYNDADDRKVLALDCLGKTIRLRCVRDVK